MEIIATQLKENSFRPYNKLAYSHDQLLSHLKVEPVSAIWHECTKDWSLAPRRVGDSYWTWIISGEGVLRLGDDKDKYVVKAKDFILFPQYCLHSLTPRPGTGTAMAMINVHFYARLYGVLDMTAHYNLAGLYKDQDSELLDFSSREAAREYCLKPTGWRQSLTARIELVLLELARYRKKPSAQTGKISQLLRLEPVFQLLESRLADPNLDVRDMAAKLDISEVYLRRLFSCQLGVSPVKYLRRQRIDNACRLLRDSVMPIRQIAQECGFRELQFFHRVFRDMTGMTPATYRRSPDF